MRVVLSFRRSFETVTDTARLFAAAAVWHPPSEVEERVAQARDFTADDVRTVFAHPETTKAVVVGDLGLLRPSLEALGWGLAVRSEPAERSSP